MTHAIAHAPSPQGGPSSYSANYMSQAIIGSLPKGLTQEVRAKIQQSVAASPSAAALKALDVNVVTARSALGKKTRRQVGPGRGSGRGRGIVQNNVARFQVINGAVMVFVTAGYSGKKFILEKAKQLGVKSIVLDGPDRCGEGGPAAHGMKGQCQVAGLLIHPPLCFVTSRSWSQMLVAEGIIEKFVPIDFSDHDTVFDKCLEGIKRAAKEVGELDGVTTFSELAVPLASRLAEALGLPHNSVEAVDNARDKHATRDVMMKVVVGIWRWPERDMH